MAKYAILSDIHSNLEALTEVLKVCKEQNVDHYVSLGDIVGYNADPKKCLEIIQSLDLVASVRGNHDEYVAANDTAMEGFNPQARSAVLWTRTQLSLEDRAYLGATPLRFTLPGTALTLVHATLDSPDHWGYVFDVHHAKDNFSYQFTQLCFCGHSHVPVAFIKKPIVSMMGKNVEEIVEWERNNNDLLPSGRFDIADSLQINLQPGHKYLFNIGSVGQPRNRDPRASFAIYDDIERSVTRYRVPYDFRLTQAKILEAKLPEKLAIRLEFGS